MVVSQNWVSLSLNLLFLFCFLFSKIYLCVVYVMALQEQRKWPLWNIPRISSGYNKCYKTNPFVFLSLVETSPRLLNHNRATLHLHVLLPNQKAANNFLNQEGSLGEKSVSLFFQLNVLWVLSITTNRLSITTRSCQSLQIACQSQHICCQLRYTGYQST